MQTNKKCITLYTVLLFGFNAAQHYADENDVADQNRCSHHILSLDRHTSSLSTETQQTSKSPVNEAADGFLI
jgi:hypothetical protein